MQHWMFYSTVNTALKCYSFVCGGGGGGRKHRKQKSIENNLEDMEWINHFDNVCNEGAERRNQTTDYDFRDETCDESLEVEISELEQREAIRHWKTGKAAGPEGILAKMLKTSDTDIVHHLKTYFNIMFEQRSVSCRTVQSKHSAILQERRC